VDLLGKFYAPTGEKGDGGGRGEGKEERERKKGNGKGKRARKSVVNLVPRKNFPFVFYLHFAADLTPPKDRRNSLFFPERARQEIIGGLILGIENVRVDAADSLRLGTPIPSSVMSGNLEKFSWKGCCTDAQHPCLENGRNWNSA